MKPYSASILPDKVIILQSINDYDVYGEKLLQHIKNTQRPFHFFKSFSAFKKKNKKLIAAILAFPFPFGIVGLHRIYLGSSPFVPIVYIGSLGGVFGILPLIDFIAILTQPNIEEYLDNDKVFMWIK